MKYTDFLKEQLNKPGSFVKDGSSRKFYLGTIYSNFPKDKIIEVGEDYIKVETEEKKRI